MGWVRVDDAFYDHDKFQAAGPLGLAQWVAALAWSNRNMKDGFIPVSASRRLLDWQGVAWRMWSGDVVGGGEDAEADAISDHLVECGLWEKVPGGYQIHDYHDYQPSAEQIRAEREKSAHRQAEWRSRNTRSNTTRNGRSNDVTNDVTDTVSSQHVTGAPNPKPKEEKEPNPSGLARKRASPLPEPFTVTDGMRRWAAENAPNVDPIAETDQFVDHHRGRGTTAKDWTATWRTWMRNAQKWHRERAHQPVNRATQRTDANLALVRQLEAKERPELA